MSHMSMEARKGVQLEVCRPILVSLVTKVRLVAGFLRSGQHSDGALNSDGPALCPEADLALGMPVKHYAAAP